MEAMAPTKRKTPRKRKLAATTTKRRSMRKRPKTSSTRRKKLNQRKKKNDAATALLNQLMPSTIKLKQKKLPTSNYLTDIVKTIIKDELMKQTS